MKVRVPLVAMDSLSSIDSPDRLSTSGDSEPKSRDKVKIFPKGWMGLKPFNETIDVFLPFKIPIRDEHQRENFPENEKFTWQSFKQDLDRTGMKLVAVIDLVPHSTHYLVDEMVQYLGFIPYYKLGCRGGTHIPSEALFRRFCDIVKRVVDVRPNWKENEFIGVHCCKGINRTGFMICKYLITHKQYDPAEAMKLFNEKRAAFFERPKYVDYMLQVTPGTGLDTTSDSSTTCDRIEEFNTPENGNTGAEDKCTVVRTDDDQLDKVSTKQLLDNSGSEKRQGNEISGNPSKAAKTSSDNASSCSSLTEEGSET